MASTSSTSAAASQHFQSDISDLSAIPVSASLHSASIASSAVFNGCLEASNVVVPPAKLLDLVPAVPDPPTTSTAPIKKGKGFGKRLSDKQRVEILDLIENNAVGLSNAEIARRYGVTRAAIQKLKLKGPEVRARYRYGSTDTRDDRKRGGHVMNVPFEKELYEWIRGLKARKVPVPPSLVKEKAKLLVPKYGLGNFQASSGWYYNFCRRFNLITAVLGEEKTAKPETMDTSLEVEETLPTPQIPVIVQPTTSMYEEQVQQYQQQMAVMAATSLQQQQEQIRAQLQLEMQNKQQLLQQKQQQEVCTIQTVESKSDRMLMLLEQQNVLLERQNTMIEDQANTIKRLYAVVTKGFEI